MKKKKAHKKRKASKKTNVMPETSDSIQRKAGGHIVPEKENLQPVTLKKDTNKRTSNITFASKRYFIVAKQFLADSRGELKKVTWPTRKELLATTAVVIVLVLLIAFYLGIVDLGLVKIIKNVIG